MPKTDERTEVIGSAMISQAEQESKEIIEKANKLREKEISEYKEAVIEKMFQDLQYQTAVIRQKSVQDKAQVEIGASRELLGNRESIRATVFQSAREKLLDFANSSDYSKKFFDDLEKCRELFTDKNSTVLVREKDMELEEKIKNILPDCSVESSSDIKIGGFIIRSKQAGILVDETLDAKLNQQNEWFLRNCGLMAI